MNSFKLLGNFVVESADMVYAADRLEAKELGIQLGLGGIDIGLVKVEELQRVIDVKSRRPRMSDLTAAKFLSGLKALTRGISEFTKEKNIQEMPEITIFGSTALMLTVLPCRTSDDIDIVGSPEFFEFMEGKNLSNVHVQVLPTSIMQLMGNWGDRVCSLDAGGIKLQIIHPMDTVMQKLMRLDETEFAMKDLPDIRRIVEHFHPSEDTITKLLCENPYRYYNAPFGAGLESAAISRNTKAFLGEFYPNLDYVSIVKSAVSTHEGHQEKVSACLPALPNQTLEESIEESEVDI